MDPENLSMFVFLRRVFALHRLGGNVFRVESSGLRAISGSELFAEELGWKVLHVIDGLI
jgi:hypothetical protein